MITNWAFRITIATCPPFNSSESHHGNHLILLGAALPRSQVDGFSLDSIAARNSAGKRSTVGANWDLLDTMTHNFIVANWMLLIKLLSVNFRVFQLY
jgi:hypothetical protein